MILNLSQQFNLNLVNRLYKCLQQHMIVIVIHIHPLNNIIHEKGVHLEKVKDTINEQENMNKKQRNNNDHLAFSENARNQQIVSLSESDESQCIRINYNNKMVGLYFN